MCTTTFLQKIVSMNINILDKGTELIIQNNF